VSHTIDKSCFDVVIAVLSIVAVHIGDHDILQTYNSTKRFGLGFQTLSNHKFNQENVPDDI
jgi:hypothetical protein